MNKPITKKASPIRILIADDHYIVRMGLIAMINSEPDMEVVAEATDGTQAVALFTKLNPDLASDGFTYAGQKWHRGHG